ncbi:unnamed protein product [Urochloa humidicola]
MLIILQGHWRRTEGQVLHRPKPILTNSECHTRRGLCRSAFNGEGNKMDGCWCLDYDLIRRGLEEDLVLSSSCKGRKMEALVRALPSHCP